MFYQKNPNSVAKKFQTILSKITKKKFTNESIQENYLEKKYRNKLRIFEMLIGLVSILSISNAIGFYELSYNNGIENLLEVEKYFVILYSVFFLTILQIILIILSQIIELELEKKLDKIPKEENIFTSGRYKKIIIDFLLIIIHPNPIFIGINFKTYNQYYQKEITRSINSVMTIIILLRFYFVFRFLLYNSSYMDYDSKKICNYYNFDTNLIYSLKSLIKKYPMKVYFYSLIIFVFVFSYSIRIFERSISEYSQYDFDNYFNSLWYVFVTMTTVGYGDYSAKTNEARIIIMISCAVGVFLISMMIVAITNIFSLDLNEVNSFIILEKIKYNDNVDNSAKNVIYNFTKSFNKNSYKKLMTQEPKKLKNFQSSIRKFKQFSDVYFNEANEFNLFNNAMSFLKQKQNEILSYKTNQEIEIKEIKKRTENLFKKLK